MERLRWKGSMEAQRQYEEANARLSRLPPSMRGKKGRKKKRRRKQQPGPTLEAMNLPYNEYLKTKWWRQKRLDKIKSVGGRCEKCRTTRQLRVHHLTYDRLGRERHTDLQVLCTRCHEYEHQCWIAANAHLDAIGRSV